MTLNQVITRLQAISLSHKQLRHFYYGNIWEYLAQPGGKVQYPACFVEHNTSSISGDRRLTIHSFRLYLLDLVNMANNAEGNETEVLSDMMSVAEDMLALIGDHSYSDTWWLDTAGSAVTLYTGKLNDYTAGVSIDVNIGTFFLSDICATPADELPENTIVVPVGGEWQWVQFTVTDASNVQTIAAVAGKRIMGVIREDMPQVEVLATPTDYREYIKDSTTGTFTWSDDNVIGVGEVLTLFVKQ